MKARLRADHVVVRAMRVLHDEGLRKFWFKLIGELGNRRMLLVAHRLEEPIPEFVPRLAVRNDLLGKSDVDAYLAFRPESDRAGLINRLDSVAALLCGLAREPNRVRVLDAVLESHRGGSRPVGLMGRIKIGPWQRHFRRRWE